MHPSCREARKKFTYDSQHQLIYAEIEGSEPCTAEYDYDALGRRIQKRITYHAPKHRNETEEKVTVSHFYWDGLRLAGESRADRPENRRWYAYNEGSYEPIAFIDYWDIVKRDEIYYYHTNINGAPEELTAEDGQYAWKGHFTLWGKSYRVEQPISTLYGQSIRFQGQYFDQETGLHYNTFRYYDPETGCFTQQDPIGLLGGINLYQYAPNPLSWVDPLGLCGIRWNAKAQRFIGPDGKFISRAQAAKSVVINPQKQAGHIKGTPQYNNRIKVGKPTSAFDTSSDADRLVKEALAKGKPVPRQPGKFDLETGSPVGTGPRGGNQTKVRVHVDSKGEVHGHPAGQEI